jgi:hypothetical protein
LLDGPACFGSRAIAVRLARRFVEILDLMARPKRFELLTPQIRSLVLDQQPETGGVRANAPNYLLRATRENAENVVRMLTGFCRVQARGDALSH